ncbi:MAG: hypothetical protein V1792_20465 [Pseudomonadota bacterium]
MRRRRSRPEAEAASFSSFVDVVCNLIGGLLLIAIISALASKDTVFNVFTPVEDTQQENARSYKFAVTDKGIYPLDQQGAFEKLVAEKRKSPDAQVVRARTRFFDWELYPHSGLVRSKLRDESPPITDRNVHTISLDDYLTDGNGKDSEKYFAYFMVTPDNEAFRLFRMARKALWTQGVRVGWGPVDPREGLVFGGEGGVRLRPQD